MKNFKIEDYKNNLTHLHVHTNYSLLDGASSIKELVKKAKDSGQKALAITDHGSMFGIVEFYKECVKQDIKPIIGCEVYVAPESRFDRESVKSGAKDLFVNARYHHLILLAKNEVGYKNLLEIVSKGYLEGFYYKPRVDLEILREHSEGLIVSSACLGGAVPQAFLKGGFNTIMELEEGEENVSQEEIERLYNEGYEKAKKIALEYKDVFGEDYYLELQNHGIKEQKYVNEMLLKLSKDTGIPLIVANDSHYTNKEDSEYHDILLRINIGATLEEEIKMEFKTDEFYLKTYDEMREVFPGPEYDEAFENTMKIADQCNFEMEFHNYKLPKYDYPEKITLEDKVIKFNNSEDYLRHLCYKGLDQYFDDMINKPVVNDYVRAKFETETMEEIQEIYKERLEYELDIISSMGFIDYFLIVWDFIAFAKNNNIDVGPGRGSAAGSLVSFTLDIIEADPIPINLYFERFLNPERVSMPDIDIDFSNERRGEVIDYVIEKYGRDRVAQIATFGTFGARSSIRDVAKVFDSEDANPSYINKILKACPLTGSISDFLETVDEVKDAYENNPVFKKIIDAALQIEGYPRHTSIHAAGVVISDKPLYNYIPTFVANNTIAVQFDMNEVEELGLLKMDFLGLRNLSIISNAERLINEKYKREGIDKEFDIYNIPMNDKKTFDLMCRGDSVGIFQFESEGMRGVLRDLKPRSIEDLTAATSLYRPGPMDNIPTYVSNKENPEDVIYLDKSLEDILDVTYGVMVYQEQVMQIVRELAGYSLGQADVLRRAMGKKQMDVMEAERKKFLYGEKDENGNVLIKGCQSNGIDLDAANKIFDLMIEFANYAFNKSHAYVYSMISYRTAYLKAHFPYEFGAALLTSVIDDTDKLALYLKEVKDMGIDVKKPDIHISERGFTTDGEHIYYGLVAIKSVGEPVVETILEERKEENFQSFFNFVYRTRDKNINSAALENLVKAGAFDQFGSRSDLLESVDHFMDSAKKLIDKYDGDTLFDFIDNIDYRSIIDLPLVKGPILREEALLEYEREVLFFYVSGHPIDLYHKGDAYHVEELNSLPDKDYRNILLFGSFNSIRKIQTRNNDTMAYVDIAGKNETISGVLFPSNYKDNKQIIDLERSNKLFILKGNLGMYNNEKQFIINDVYLPVQSDEEFKELVRMHNVRYNKVNEIEKQRALKEKKENKVSEGLYIKVRDMQVFNATLKYFENLSLSAKNPTISVFVYIEDIRQLKQLSYKIDEELAIYLAKARKDTGTATLVL